MRLDQAIAARYPDISRRKARELISAHRVLVNERPVSIASRVVNERDRVVISEVLPDITTLAMTSEWIAVEKPAGVPVQPVRDRTIRSLEEMVRLRLKQDRVSPELYLVHRLDTGTSGVVVFARTKEFAAELSAMFADREIRKTYLALVDGVITEPMHIDSPIEEKDAVSHVEPKSSDGKSTLVEVRTETGRTHQIRIHMASVHHPVLGDARYGSKKSAERLMLHAWKIEHPRFGTLEAPPPADLIRSTSR